MHPKAPSADVQDWEAECLLLLDKLEREAERRAAAEEERDAAVAQLAEITAKLEEMKEHSKLSAL